MLPSTQHPPSVIRGLPAFAERHYSPQELADLWGVDPNTIRRLFQDREGVLKIGTPRRGKRSYTTLRIPESVVEKVYRERTK